MIVLLFLICGVCGVAVGALCAAMWNGIALLFGFPPPTGDQISGMMMLFGATATLGSAGIAGYVLITDG
jgi:hypothetical protein